MLYSSLPPPQFEYIVSIAQFLLLLGRNTFNKVDYYDSGLHNTTHFRLSHYYYYLLPMLTRTYMNVRALRNPSR